jgi:hypothetical protein
MDCASTGRNAGVQRLLKSVDGVGMVGVYRAGYRSARRLLTKPKGHKKALFLAL